MPRAVLLMLMGRRIYGREENAHEHSLQPQNRTGMNRDFRDLCAAFNVHGVEYLVVGAHLESRLQSL